MGGKYEDVVGGAGKGGGGGGAGSLVLAELPELDCGTAYGLLY